MAHDTHLGIEIKTAKDKDVSKDTHLRGASGYSIQGGDTAEKRDTHLKGGDVDEDMVTYHCYSLRGGDKAR